MSTDMYNQNLENLQKQINFDGPTYVRTMLNIECSIQNIREGIQIYILDKPELYSVIKYNCAIEMNVASVLLKNFHNIQLVKMLAADTEKVYKSL